ncbi:NACHT domain-containing protein [Qipengyuania sp. GH25]|uniref:NACHT domain-containing protein n=1 Tax=Qipengyuania pacifica TaxID=2860199 RepID=A0ABS7JDE9_9SPHN|nr:NACHT domain-containing protein [Qipengyuania aerophila]MBX7487056.1 NACHT domain-containing protein [Qipengyuania aerophila]
MDDVEPGAFDPNKFAAEVVIQAVDAAVGKVGGSSAVKKLRRLYQQVSDAYAPYLEKTYRRVSTIRTFLKPSESIDLLSAYVPVDLECDPEQVAASELLDRVHHGKSFVINGLAGRGKSVLMRFLAVSMYHSPRGKLPLFLELRNLNSLTTKDLLQYIHAQYKSDSDLRFDDFVHALHQGYFVLLLDGFDEISPNDRDSIERQILELVDEHPECSIVVSGRYDDRFYSWERFSSFKLLPMTRQQTRDLIEKAEYDERVKRNFLKRLTEEFFEKHESFLNTPLLAIMLMRTFEEYAEIPHSLHEFYRNAFDTLVRRHDAMKSQFLRKTHSGCTAEEFKRIFSSFCVLTYSKSAFSFYRGDAIEYLSSAIRQQEINAEPEKVLDDLIESVCLLHEEGFEISFVHRSFQEYFCALFVASAPSGFVERYLETANVRVHDDVLPMLIGINQDRVEDEWANEFVSDVLRKYPKRDVSRHCRFVADRLPKWGVEIMGNSTFVTILEHSKLDRCALIIRQFYPAVFSKHQNVRARTRQDFDDLEKAYLKELVRLEESGVEALKGLSVVLADHNTKEGPELFAFEVDDRFCDFFDIVYDGNLESWLRSFEAIQKNQASRKRSGEAFIDDLFA